VKEIVKYWCMENDNEAQERLGQLVRGSMLKHLEIRLARSELRD